MKNLVFTLSMIGLMSCDSVTTSPPGTKSHRTPYEIADEAPNADWRNLDPDNTLYLELETGLVVIELAPKFAPGHVTNTKALVRSGVFDNTSFYRVIDGFVAQGGPADVEALGAPKSGSLSIPGEMTLRTSEPMEFTRMKMRDGYAGDTGFVDGFAAGRTKNKKTNWLLHCYGALGMGRDNAADSGGTELYVVIGHSQRYLDRNTTVFGRVIDGMDKIQALHRSTNVAGAVDVSGKNKILSIRVASDIPSRNRVPLQVMKTDSTSFRALIKSRKNRKNEWFIYQHNYMDACGIPVPVRVAPLR